MTEYQEENLSQRFKSLRISLGKGQKMFANEANIKQSQVSEIENGKRNITAAILIALEDAFNVNRKWLETGEGDMFLTDQGSRGKMRQQPTEGYVPVYDITFSLGFTPTFINSQTPEILGYVNFPELRGSTYVVQAKGNSMAPLINDRDFVGIRPVKNKKNIDFGNPYGIITEDLAVFKKIKKFKEDEDKILLISENPEHESYPIDKNEIIHLFSVIGILSVKSITY